MPTGSRLVSKSSTQSRSTRDSRRSSTSQDKSSTTTMDNPDAAQPFFSSPANLPQRHGDRNHDIVQWIAAKDEFSYADPNYGPEQMYLTGSDASFMTEDLPATTGASWSTALSMDNVILEQCQPFMNEEPYQLSSTGAPTNSGSQPFFDAMAIEPAINLSNAPYSGSISLGNGMTDGSFKHDFASGCISYDSSSSNYMSPPVSPELPGQTWPDNDYGTSGDYATHGAAAFMYPNPDGYPHQLSPPSPPMSDGDSHAALASGRQPLSGGQLPLDSTIQVAETCNIKCSRTGYRHLESAMVGNPVKTSGTTDQKSAMPSRPAQRILKPASEKPRGYDQGIQLATSSAHSKLKEKPETAQPRNHQLYKASPGKDGLFRCPFAKENQCAHVPTKQKCAYDKYLDSHLKPYQCKHADCLGLQFSSNACLFRHEREAHGMHFYGKNPHRCHYAGCDRAIEGFPRRWNLHDHMRRVHKHNPSQLLENKEDFSGCEVPSKRKGSDAPASCQMKRTSSSQSKARVASASYSRDDHEVLDSRYHARQAQPRRSSHVQTFDLVNQQNMDFAGHFPSGLEHLSYGNNAARMSYGFSYSA